MDRPFVVERSKYETRTRNYERKMMHDMFMQKCDDCFEGFIKVNCKHCRGTRFHLKIVKILQKVPFSKGKNETKEEVLNKSKSLVKIFEVVFLGILSYKAHTFDVYKKA